MKKRLFCLASSCMFAAALFAGCGQSSAGSVSASGSGDAGSSTAETSGETTTIKFWHTWQGLEAEKFEKIIEGFSEVRPDIKVEVLGSTTEEKQLISMTSGDSFDVGFTMDCIANKWASTGALADMTPYMEANGTDTDNYIQTLMELGQIDGKQYGIPFTMDTYMLFYNKDILAEAGYTEPPKTWEEFSEMCEAVTQTDSNGDYTRLGYVPNYPGVTVAAIPYAYGASLYDAETNTVLANSPEMVAAMEQKYSLYSGFYDNAKVQKFRSGLGQYQSAENPFFTGAMAFSIEGEWFPTFIAEYAPDLNWGVAPLPSVEGNEENNDAFLQCGMLVIPEASKNKEAAYAFIEWLTSDECQVELCAQKGNLPATHSGLENESLFEQNPSLEPFAELANQENVRALPSVPFMGQYQNELSAVEEQMYNGDYTPQEALDKVTESIQAVADEWAAGNG